MKFEQSQLSMLRLEAFSAAFGTSSSAAMFHLVGITPEVRVLRDVFSSASHALRRLTYEELRMSSLRRKTDPGSGFLVAVLL